MLSRMGGWSSARRLVTGRNRDLLVAVTALVVLVVCACVVPSTGPVWLGVVVSVLGAVPLYWRRVAPLPVLLLFFAGPAAQALIVGPHDTNIGQFVFLLVVMFSFGVHARRRDVPPGLASAYVLGLIIQIHSPANGPGDIIVTPPILALLPFLAGRLLRRQRRDSARLRKLSEQLDRRREADAEAATLAERARIAREVHDVVAHSVGVMVVQAGVAEELADSDPAAARQAMAAVRSTGRDALTELRRLLGLMVADPDAAALRPQPGLAEIERLLDQLRAAGQRIDACVTGDAESLSPGVDLAAYRVVQEALTNARKHGGGAARLQIARQRSGITIEVTDEGAGPSDEPDGPTGAGHGLVGMRERVALYGGDLRVGPRPEGGWRVAAWLPREPA